MQVTAFDNNSLSNMVGDSYIASKRVSNGGKLDWPLPIQITPFLYSLHCIFIVVTSKDMNFKFGKKLIITNFNYG